MSDISIDLGLEAKQLYEELQNTTARFVKFANDAQVHGDEAGKKFSQGFGSAASGLGNSLSSGLSSGLTSVVGTLTAALAALGITHEIKDVIEYGAKIQDLSDRYGVAADALQRFGNAAEKNGSSLEAVAKGFRFLEVNQAKALSGNDAMVLSFASLGISVQDLQTLRPEEIMLKIGSSSLNAADVVKVLGKSAIELRPTLAGLADGTIEFGNAIADIEVKYLKEADDNIKTLKQNVTILVGTGLGEFFEAADKSAGGLIGTMAALGIRIVGFAEAFNKVAGLDVAKYFATQGLLGHAPDLAGAKQANDDAIKQADEAQIRAEAGNENRLKEKEKKKRRDLGTPPESGGEGGKTDDQGRELKREQREADREAKDAEREAAQTERDAAKLATVERERYLESLGYQERLNRLQTEGADALKASENSRDEDDRIKAKLAYFDIQKQIESEEKKHVQEMAREERDRAREVAKAEKAEKASRTQPLTLAESAAEARAKDETYRRSHGAYEGHGTKHIPGNRFADTEGLISSGGLVTTGLDEGDVAPGVSPALSDKDWQNQFTKKGPLQTGADWHKQFEKRGLSRADQLKESIMKDSGKDEKKSDLVAALDGCKVLKDIKDNTQDMGANK